MRRFMEWVVRRSWFVIAATLVVTAVLGAHIRQLHVVIDPAAMFPQGHPYVVTSNEFERLFGSKRIAVIGITARQGDVFQAPILDKVATLTQALLHMPGIVPGTLRSLAAPKVKAIAGDADGMSVRPMMDGVPRTPEQLAALRRQVETNPVYLGGLVSADRRTTAIIIDVVNDARGSYAGVTERINQAVAGVRDDTVEIAVGGSPQYLVAIERYSQRMALLFPLAVLITGLIHYEAFRTLQGLILPLVTALLAVVLGLGVMGWSGVTLDAFNATTPILILAVAAGHAVQVLKRYYEEFHRLRVAGVEPAVANRNAVVEAMVRIGPVMLTAGGVAAAGFLSLVVFETQTIRTFGIFTGLGILAALVLELTFIPALRSRLPHPSEREGRREREHTGWDRLTEGIAAWVLGPRRRLIYVVAGALMLVWGLGASRVVIDNAYKSYFSPGLPLQIDDQRLNERLAGTNTMYLLVQGRDEDAVKDPAVLRSIDHAQRFLEAQPHVGKTVSIVDFLRRMNRALHDDDAAFDVVPESAELVSQYLLLYSMSGEPGDFDAYVDYAYRSAGVWVFLRSDSTAYLEDLVHRLRANVAFPPGVQVRVGGSLSQGAALNSVMVRDKILNILQIAGVIFIVSSLVFRSFLAGGLVLAPLAVAVLANFGFMGLGGIPLNVPISVISAMAVGIGADYAIYVIYRLREELARGLAPDAALHLTLTTAGKAVLFVASAVAGGYGVLLLSWGFRLHMWLGVLIAVSMLVSSLATLTLLPALIWSWQPRFVFGAGASRLRPAVATAGLLAALAWAASSQAASAPSAPEVMEKAYWATRFQDSLAVAKWSLVNRAGDTRVRQTTSVTKLQANGKDNDRVVRFLAPPDVKGTAILTVEHTGKDDDIWVYLPALKKVRRLVSSNKKDAFAGTDFSYGDVIGHRPEEWQHTLAREEALDGEACWVVESQPKNDTVKDQSGYSKRLTWVRKDNGVIARMDLWDRAGAPYKRYTATSLRQLDAAKGKWQAMRVEMLNLVSGHHTVVEITDVKIDQKVKDDVFLPSSLEREP